MLRMRRLNSCMILMVPSTSCSILSGVKVSTPEVTSWLATTYCIVSLRHRAPLGGVKDGGSKSFSSGVSVLLGLPITQRAVVQHAGIRIWFYSIEHFTMLIDICRAFLARICLQWGWLNVYFRTERSELHFQSFEFTLSWLTSINFTTQARTLPGMHEVKAALLESKVLRYRNLLNNTWHWSWQSNPNVQNLCSCLADLGTSCHCDSWYQLVF